MIKIYNEDCLETMNNTLREHSVDIVITSPPYNNSRPIHTKYQMMHFSCRYEEYDDCKSNDAYCDWICEVFHGYNRILKENGVVLFNLSYGQENPDIMIQCLYNIITRTPFMCADIITWKKKSTIPSPASNNKLDRICEYVFVFCRRSENNTFITNKQLLSVSDKNQKYYSILYNYIEAKNNDFPTEMNNATFSTEFVLKLIDMYCPVISEDVCVYDSFMGTGTTAVACKMVGLSCVGSEISDKQCEFAENRLRFNNSNKFVSQNGQSEYEKFDWGIY